ncbi:UNVERIFIED_CONTAM: Pollen-specific protein C13 [Sesamum calycinum]|uniref:Pollen-specific protein C13 n=1 Tax=Sesamum calycinum TaxID=2727403 RepID=A0AAW2M973_9LAMI
MARLTQVAIILAATLCFLSLVDVADSHAPKFIVEGKVYCEVCRANFTNRYSEPMAGAKVKLECKNEPAAEVTLTLNNGFHDEFRNANPLAFTRKEALPECAELFKELEEAKKDE